MRKILLLTSFLLSIFSAFTQVGNTDIQVSQIPSPGLNPCGIKDTTNVIGLVSKVDSLRDFEITIKLPEGVLYNSGSVIVNTAPSGISVTEKLPLTDLSRPVFLVTGGSLNTADYVEFSIERTAVCSSIQNSIDGKVFKDSIEVTYDRGTDSLLTDYDTTLNPYTLNVAILGVQTITTASTNVGDTVLNRPVTIVQGGVGCITNFVHKVALDTLAISSYTIVYNGDTLIPNGSSTTDTLYFDINLLSPTFSGVGDGDGCFENGETVVLLESFVVKLCNPAPVRHRAFYGCSLGEVCQISASQPGNILLGSELPNVTISNVGLPSFASLCDTTWLTYKVKNNNTNSGAAALDILLEIGRGGNSVALTTFSTSAMTNHTARKEVVLFKINDTIVPIRLRSDLLPGVAAASSPDIAVYNLLTFDPDSSGVGLEDIDGDGFYDDLPPGQEFEFTYGYVVDPIFGTCGIGGKAFVNWEHMYTQVVHKNQCGLERPAKKIDYNYNYFGKNYAGAVSELVAPTDLDPVDSNFTVSVSTHFNRSGYGCGTGINEEYEVRIVLPAGITWDSVTMPNLPAGLNPVFLMEADTFVYRISGGYNTAGSSRIFEFPFKIDCGIFQSTRLDLSYISRYRCLTGCLEEDIECSTLPSINTHCPTSCRGIVTKGFEANRTSPGYTDSSKTAFVTLDTAVHNTKYYLHGDTMLIKTYAVMKDTSLANAFIDISYNGVPNLTFASGKIRIHDLSSGIYDTVLTVAPTYVSSPRKRFDFDLSSYRSIVSPTYNYGEGLEADTIWLEIKMVVEGTSFSSTVDHPFISMYGRFYHNVASGSERSCDRYGDIASMNHAYTYVTEWKNGETFTECGTARIRSGIYSRIFNGQTFPNEYRPPYEMDSVVFTLPSYMEFIPNSATFTGGWTETAGDVVTLWDSITRKLIVKPAGNFYEPTFGHSFMHAEIGVAIQCGAPSNLTQSPGINTTVDWKRFAYNDSVEVVKNEGESLYTKTFVAPSLFLQSPNPTSQGTQENVSWDIQVDKTSSGTTYYNWLRIEKVAGISIDSVFNITTGSEVPVFVTDTNGYLYAQVDTMSGISSYNFRLKATYSSCADRSFDVNIGWACFGYPTDYSSVNAVSCYDNSLTLTLEPKNSIVSIDVNDTITVTPVDMCQQFEIEMNVNSTDVADVINPSIEFNVPGGVIGLTIDSVLIEYPFNSGDIQNVPYSVLSATRIKIDLEGHTKIDSIGGIYGTANNAGADGRTAFVKLHAKTTCDFIANSQILFNIYGEKPCSGNADGAGGSDVSENISINGALKNYDFFTDVTVPGTDVESCDSLYKFTYKGTFFSLSTNDSTLNDTAAITIPNFLNFVSYKNIEPDSLVYAYSRTIGMNTILYFAIPDGMKSGQRFEMDLFTNTTIGCDISATTELSTSTVSSGVMCSGTPCNNLKSETGYSSEDFTIVKPSLSFISVESTSKFSTSATEEITAYLSFYNVDTITINSYAYLFMM